jgi:hypothetical protein
VAGSCEYGHISGSIKGRELNDHMRDYQLFKRDSDGITDYSVAS